MQNILMSYVFHTMKDIRSVYSEILDSAKSQSLRNYQDCNVKFIDYK